ncbi:cell envelope integrity protein TolA [Polaromonas aquatica]|uniref:cell envelope integrity protein TolA n=1 Tax=Polaromonas aquatica TaxID=332657 RepID=UPI003D6493E0
MPSAADRLEFGPPRDSGSLRAFGLALLAHILLMAALTWGINWKHSDKAVSFEAEIWSSVPQAAAPKLVEAPTAPPPPPAPPTPEVKTPPPAPNVDIALEQEKKRKLLQQQKEAENQKQEKLKAEQLAKKEKEQKAKEEQAKRKAAEEAKKAEAKKQDAKDDEKQKLADAAAKKQREDNLKRMMGQAGATGSADATGTAQKAGGPSANYKARLAALFKRHVYFPNSGSIEGNPKAIVQVQVSSTGLILSSKLTKSSGVQAWDDAVLRAVKNTERIPPDENGKVITDFPVEFGPKD